MMNYLKNAIAKLYNVVSAPVAATRSALAGRLESVRESAALLYNKFKNQIGYGETLKDVVEHQAEEQHPEHDEDEIVLPEDIDLTPEEHEIAMNSAYKSF